MQVDKDMSDAGPGFNTKETTMKVIIIILAAAIAGDHAATAAAWQTAVLYPWDIKEIAVAEIGSVKIKQIAGDTLGLNFLFPGIRLA